MNFFVIVTHPSTNPAQPGLTSEPVVSCCCSRLKSPKLAAVFSQTLWNLICVAAVVSCGSSLSSGGQSVLL